MERSRISSKKHYDGHKEAVLGRIRKYQKDKLEQEIIEKYYELQQEKKLDLHTGDVTQTEYNKKCPLLRALYLFLYEITIINLKFAH
jgi:hypothetical protein